jgi:hypothetical protein
MVTDPLELPGDGKEMSEQDSWAAIKSKLMVAQPTLAADERPRPQAMASARRMIDGNINVVQKLW